MVDSWATCSRGDSVNEDDQAAVAGALRRMVEASGGPVLVIVHTRKSGAETLEDVAGSHQRAAAADVVLLVTADRSDGRVMASNVKFAKLRDAGDEWPDPVRFAIGRDDEGRWTLDDGSGGPLSETARAILEMLKKAGAMSENEIRTELGGGDRNKKANGPATKKVLSGLRRLGKVAQLSDRRWVEKEFFPSLLPESGLGG